MGRLTIKLRIAAHMALIAVLFAAFMVLFFPRQASKMGNRMMTDSAVTVASLFAANIEPAYDALGFGGEDIIETALRNLAGDSILGEAVNEGSPGASSEYAPIAIQRITVYNDAGIRLDGRNDEGHSTEALAPQRGLVIEHLDDEGLLRVTAPVYAGATFQGLLPHRLLEGELEPGAPDPGRRSALPRWRSP
jgi:hypothetical protein